MRNLCSTKLASPKVGNALLYYTLRNISNSLTRLPKTQRKTFLNVIQTSSQFKTSSTNPKGPSIKRIRKPSTPLISTPLSEIHDPPRSATRSETPKCCHLVSLASKLCCVSNGQSPDPHCEFSKSFQTRFDGNLKKSFTRRHISSTCCIG